MPVLPHTGSSAFCGKSHQARRLLDSKDGRLPSIGLFSYFSCIRQGSVRMKESCPVDDHFSSNISYKQTRYCIDDAERDSARLKVEQNPCLQAMERALLVRLLKDRILGTIRYTGIFEIAFGCNEFVALSLTGTNYN